jgi:hypothetical protein
MSVFLFLTGLLIGVIIGAWTVGYWLLWLANGVRVRPSARDWRGI